jgi:hypothetical protein
MADVNYKAINSPKSLTLNTDKIVEAKQQSQLFDGIMKTESNAVSIGTNLVNTLTKQEEIELKKKQYEANLVGKRDYLEFEQSLIGKTATEKESAILSKFSQLGADDVPVEYRQPFEANLLKLHSNVKKERIVEDTETASTMLSERIKTDFDLGKVDNTLLENRVSEISEILPDIDKSQVAFEGLKSIANHSIEDIVNKNTDVKSFDIEGFVNKDGKDYIENKTVNMKVPKSVYDFNEKYNENISKLNEMLNSNKFLKSKNKNTQKRLNSLFKGLESQRKSEISKIKQFSEDFLNETSGYGQKVFNSYQINPEEMKEVISNTCYRNDGSIDNDCYVKKMSDYSKNYTDRQNQLDLMENYSDNIHIGNIPSKKQEFAYNFYENRAKKDIGEIFLTGNTSKITKYVNSAGLIKEPLKEIIMNNLNSPDLNMRKKSIETFMNLKNSTEGNNILSKTLKPEERFKIQATSDIINFYKGSTEEEIIKHLDNINNKTISLNSRETKNLKEEINIPEDMTPSQQSFFIKDYMIAVENGTGEEWKNRFEDFELKNKKEIGDYTFLTRDNNLDYSVTGFKDTENIEDFNNYIGEYLKDYENIKGVKISKVKVLVSNGKNQKLQPIDEYGNPTGNPIDLKDISFSYKNNIKKESIEEEKNKDNMLNVIGRNVEEDFHITMNTIGKKYEEFSNSLSDLKTNIDEFEKSKLINVKKNEEIKTINNTFIKTFSYDNNTLKKTLSGIKDNELIYTTDKEKYFNIVLHKLNDNNYIRKRAIEIQEEEKKHTNNYNDLEFCTKQAIEETKNVLNVLKSNLRYNEGLQ